MQATRNAVLLPILLQLHDAHAHAKGHFHATQGVFRLSLALGISEEDEHGVPDELVDRAAAIDRDRGHLRQVGIDDRRQALGLERVAEVGELNDVGEKDGQILPGMGALLLPGIGKNALVDLGRQVLRQPGRQVLELPALLLDDLAVADLLLQERFSFLSQVPLGRSIDELTLDAVEIGEAVILGPCRKQGVDAVLSLDADMDGGNEDRALAVDVRDEIFDLWTRNAELLQHIGEVGVGHVAQDGEEALEVVIDLQDLQTLGREIGGGDGVAEIEEAEVHDVRLVEEIFDLHARPFSRSLLNSVVAPPLRHLTRRRPPGRNAVGNAVGKDHLNGGRRRTRQYQVAVIDRGEDCSHHQSRQEGLPGRAAAEQQIQSPRAFHGSRASQASCASGPI